MKLSFQVVGLLAVLQVWGCTSTTSFSQWQQGLQRYVGEQANGDLSALSRELMSAPQPTFGVLGGKRIASSTDIVGLLVGFRQVQQRPACVFMVARISRGQIEQLQPVAVAVDGGRYLWWVGPGDPKALAAYKAQHAAAKVTGNWPPYTDRFTLSDAPGALRVTELSSNAVWNLPLGKPASPPPTPRPPPRRPAGFYR